jgi:hypothetical protein
MFLQSDDRAVAVLAGFFLIAAWAVCEIAQGPDRLREGRSRGLQGPGRNGPLPPGSVSCHGEIWRARVVDDGFLESGSVGIVEMVHGLPLWSGGGVTIKGEREEGKH